VFPIKAASLVMITVTSIVGTALLALLLGLNSGHSSRVRLAWSEWSQNPTVENKKHLDVIEAKVEREYDLYRVSLFGFILLDGYLGYRSFVWRKRAMQV
jgi:hypothetical protein